VAEASRRGRVSHAHDVAVSPFVDRADAAPEPASKSERVFAPQNLTHLAQIVALGGDAARDVVAKRAQSAFER
jgi:hypothetical protein